MKTLKPFQLEAVQFICTRRYALLADAMGLGKTLSAIGALNRILPDKVLIVCPASIKEQWKKAILEEGIIWPWAIQVVAGRNARIYGECVTIINYDLLTSPEILNQLKNFNWEVGVFDEIHYCKSLEAKRTKAVFSKDGIVHNCLRSILLTGTPVLNRPIELYPMLKVMAPDVLGKENTYEKFGLKFCAGWYDSFDLNVDGASNEEELNARLKKQFMLRRTEKDVELQLPEKRYQVFMIDGNEKKLRELEVLERKAFKKQNFDMDIPLATLRRELAEEKVEKSLSLIDDSVEQVDKLVIFAYHKSVISRLMDHFGSKAVKIDGSCSALKRGFALKMFQEFKEVKVLVAQITAGGQGLDGMQDVCNHALFLEISWTPAEIQQAIARVHRMGQSKSVLIQFIVWENSVESHMMRTALDKVETINKIIN